MPDRHGSETLTAGAYPAPATVFDVRLASSISSPEPVFLAIARAAASANRRLARRPSAAVTSALSALAAARSAVKDQEGPAALPCR